MALPVFQELPPALTAIIAPASVTSVPPIVQESFQRTAATSFSDNTLSFTAVRPPPGVVIGPDAFIEYVMTVSVTMLPQKQVYNPADPDKQDKGVPLAQIPIFPAIFDPDNGQYPPSRTTGNHSTFSPGNNPLSVSADKLTNWGWPKKLPTRAGGVQMEAPDWGQRMIQDVGHKNDPAGIDFWTVGDFLTVTQGDVNSYLTSCPLQSRMTSAALTVNGVVVTWSPLDDMNFILRNHVPTNQMNPDIPTPSRGRRHISEGYMGGQLRGTRASGAVAAEMAAIDSGYDEPSLMGGHDWTNNTNIESTVTIDTVPFAWPDAPAPPASPGPLATYSSFRMTYTMVVREKFVTLPWGLNNLGPIVGNVAQLDFYANMIPDTAAMFESLSTLSSQGVNAPDPETGYSTLRPPNAMSKYWPGAFVDMEVSISTPNLVLHYITYEDSIMAKIPRQIPYYRDTVTRNVQNIGSITFGMIAGDVETYGYAAGNAWDFAHVITNPSRNTPQTPAPEFTVVTTAVRFPVIPRVIEITIGPRDRDLADWTWIRGGGTVAVHNLSITIGAVPNRLIDWDRVRLRQIFRRAGAKQVFETCTAYGDQIMINPTDGSLGLPTGTYAGQPLDIGQVQATIKCSLSPWLMAVGGRYWAQYDPAAESVTPTNVIAFDVTITSFTPTTLTITDGGGAKLSSGVDVASLSIPQQISDRDAHETVQDPNDHVRGGSIYGGPALFQRPGLDKTAMMPLSFGVPRSGIAGGIIVGPM